RPPADLDSVGARRAEVQASKLDRNIVADVLDRGTGKAEAVSIDAVGRGGIQPRERPVGPGEDESFYMHFPAEHETNGLHAAQAFGQAVLGLEVGVPDRALIVAEGG